MVVGGGGRSFTLAGCCCVTLSASCCQNADSEFVETSFIVIRSDKTGSMNRTAHTDASPAWKFQISLDMTPQEMT